MKNTAAKNKNWITAAMVAVLVGAAVSANAAGFSAQTGGESSVAIIPLLASVAFAIARKRS